MPKSISKSTHSFPSFHSLLPNALFGFIRLHSPSLASQSLRTQDASSNWTVDLIFYICAPILRQAVRVIQTIRILDDKQNVVVHLQFEALIGWKPHLPREIMQLNHEVMDKSGASFTLQGTWTALRRSRASASMDVVVCRQIGVCVLLFVTRNTWRPSGAEMTYEPLVAESRAGQDDGRHQDGLVVGICALISMRCVK